MKAVYKCSSVLKNGKESTTGSIEGQGDDGNSSVANPQLQASAGGRWVHPPPRVQLP